MNHIYVSVIIPVYNERDKLRNCLEALTSQTYLESQYEIIVIDNNSEENIREIVSQFEQVILTHETTRGSYAAAIKEFLSLREKFWLLPTLIVFPIRVG